MIRTLLLASALVTSVALIPANGQPASGSVPQALTGRWTRDVKALPAGAPTGVWKMVVRRSGAVGFYTPHTSYVDFTTTFATPSPGRLVVGTVPICTSKGTYRWKVTGKLLSLVKVRDTCSARVQLYAGTWKHA